MQSKVYCTILHDIIDFMLQMARTEQFVNDIWSLWNDCLVRLNLNLTDYDKDHLMDELSALSCKRINHIRSYEQSKKEVEE